jgi:hypothetical protein
VTLFCAEPLRALACLVVDSLNARGFNVRLVSGPQARSSLRQSVRGPSFGLRVVCVPRPLHANELVQMRKVLDPYLRGDLLITPLLTPHEVIDQIVRFGQPPRSIQPTRRHTKSYFVNPTLVERPVEPRRWMGYGLAGTAATAAALGALYVGANPAHLQVARREAPPVQNAPVAAPSRLVDETVHSAVATPSDLDWIIIEDDEEELDYPEPKVSRDPVPRRPRRPRAMQPVDEEPEEIIIIEDDEDLRPPPPPEPESKADPEFEAFETLLLEEAAPELPAADSGEMHHTVTYDPFAAPSDASPNLHWSE